MMGQDLEDLVIDENIKRDNKKGKGILTILALLIAILIIVIMMAKTVMGENDPDIVSNKNKKDEASLISPELLLADEDTNKDKKSNDEHLNDITSMLNDKDSSVKNEIKGDTVEVNDDTKDVKPEKDKEKLEKVEKKKVEKHHKREEVKKEIVKSKPRVEEKLKPKPVKEKKVEKKVEKKIEKKPKNHSLEGSYYIQVGSFSHKPSDRFLSVITNSGFSYKLHSSGKLLIGSYSSRANANIDLPRVKDRINKSAFVIKIK